MITLSNITKHSKQEVFDKVYKHLLTQNAKSEKEYDGVMGCAYRGENGLTCSIGCLMSDEEYDEDFEGSSVGFSGFDTYFKDDKDDIRSLLNNLQSIHDSYPPKEWLDNLNYLASKNYLTTPKM